MFTLSTANFRTVEVFPLQVLACFCLVQQIFNFSSISDFAYEKQLKNSFQLPKPTKNTRKIANKFMTVASGEIFTKYDVICHVAKEKDARSVNSTADVIFPSNPTL